MYYLGTYSNDYCGCNEEEGIVADSYEDVEAYMADGLNNYAERHEDVAREEWERQVECGEADAEENFYDSLAYENYIGSCTYDIKECTENDSRSWVDIR